MDSFSHVGDNKKLHQGRKASPTMGPAKVTPNKPPEPREAFYAGNASSSSSVSTPYNGLFENSGIAFVSNTTENRGTKRQFHDNEEEDEDNESLSNEAISEGESEGPYPAEEGRSSDALQGTPVIGNVESALPENNDRPTLERISKEIEISVFGFRCRCTTVFGDDGDQDNLRCFLHKHFGKKEIKCKVVHNIGIRSGFPWKELAKLLRLKRAALLASSGHLMLGSLDESKTKRHFCNRAACHNFNNGFSRKECARKHIQSQTACTPFGFGQAVALVEKYTTPDGKEKLGRALRLSYVKSLLQENLNKRQRIDTSRENADDRARFEPEVNVYDYTQYILTGRGF